MHVSVIRGLTGLFVCWLAFDLSALPQNLRNDCPERNVAPKAFSLVLTNGYGDVYRMNMLRDRSAYQAYRGVCSYRGFSLSGCSTTGEVVMLRIKATATMPEHYSIVSTSLRWGTTMYFLNDVFHPLNSSVMAGYENWYPFDMSCSVAFYVNSGGFGHPAVNYSMPDMLQGSSFGVMNLEDRGDLFRPAGFLPEPKAFSLVLTNGYGDVYRMNMLRDRSAYQAYRGVCSYRGFSLSGCSTTGEVVMLRIKATATMPEHFSLLSTSLRWGTTMYVLNDVFRPLNSSVMAGYENWYPFDMSCSVAFYVNSGGFGVGEPKCPPEPVTACRDSYFTMDAGAGTNLIGALLPLSGDLSDLGLSYLAALNLAVNAMSNVPGMPPIRLLVEDTGTDPAIAYEKLATLRSNGCHLVLGPESSEECRILKIYANENDVLLISSSATAIPLALPDDNLMRLTIDDSHQARALADLLLADGITDLAVLSRSDIYGEGFLEVLIREYNARGGTVFATNYCPRIPVLIPEVVSNIAGQVGVRSAVRGANRVGMVTILFGEGVNVLAAAADHPAFGAVRWYGCDGMAQNHALLTNAAAAAMAARTRYVCSTFGRFTNNLYNVVENEIGLATGSSFVPHYPMSMYDGFCLAALALQATGSTQTMASLIAAIRAVAGSYSGCTGPIIFNAADDRAAGSYDFYEVDEVSGAYQWLDLRGKLPVAPGNITASCGAYASGIKVAWNSVSGAAKYELFGSLSDRFESAIKIAELERTEIELTDIPADIPCYFRVRAVNAQGQSAFSQIAEGWAQSRIGPCLRLNGAKADACVLSGDNISVTVELHPAQRAGSDADWWLAVQTPAGLYYRNAAGQWLYAADGVFTPVWQGPLVELPATEILNFHGLAAGQYVFYFGVDARNGILDPSDLWLDSLILTVY